MSSTGICSVNAEIIHPFKPYAFLHTKLQIYAPAIKNITREPSTASYTPLNSSYELSSFASQNYN